MKTKPIVINIKNLIGTVNVTNEKDLKKLEEDIVKTLLKVVSTIPNLDNEELSQDKTLLHPKGSENQD